MAKRLENGGYSVVYKDEQGEKILERNATILYSLYNKIKLKTNFEIISLGLNAHEFIIDCKPFKSAGIDVIDIAKRLIDYGYRT